VLERAENVAKTHGVLPPMLPRKTSPNPGGLLVVDEIGGYFHKIYVMNTNGSEIRGLAPKSLVQGRTFQAAVPDWSPDGRRIAFVGWRGSIPAEIVVMGANGGSQVWLTSNDAHDADPAWSPDGARIVFARGGIVEAIDAPAKARSSESEIYVMNTDGTEETRLTDNGVGERYPAWQPIPQAPSTDQRHAVPGKLRHGT